MADTKDGPELHPATVELASGANFGSITTVFPSGLSQTHIVWVGADGERLVSRRLRPTFGTRAETGWTRGL